MEALNDISFTDTEWKRFYTAILANQNNGIVEKTRLIQEDNVQTFLFDNGEQKNLRIFDRKHLKDAPARKFIRDRFDNGYGQTEGTGIADIMPPLNPFKKDAGREEKKTAILDKIKALFNRFYDLVGRVSSDDSGAEASKHYCQPEAGQDDLSMAAEPNSLSSTP